MLFRSEGTNGIQAIDLVGRKLSMNNGAAPAALMKDARATAREARETNDPRLVSVADRLEGALDVFSEATDWMIATMRSNRTTALYGATAYLRLAGDVAGGFYLTRSAIDQRQNSRGDRAIALARFFAEETLASAGGHLGPITMGSRMGDEDAALLASASE